MVMVIFAEEADEEADGEGEEEEGEERDSTALARISLPIWRSRLRTPDC